MRFWTDEKVENLQSVIQDFQAIVAKHVATHQTSYCCIEKFNALWYFREDIR